MPWQETTAEPFLTYNGVQVNHVRKDDCADMPSLDFWFEVSGMEFDIRDLPVGSREQRNMEGEHQIILMKQAINAGYVNREGVDWVRVQQPTARIDQRRTHRITAQRLARRAL